jgi:hypothetical protein
MKHNKQQNQKSNKKDKSIERKNNLNQKKRF